MGFAMDALVLSVVFGMALGKEYNHVYVFYISEIHSSLKLTKAVSDPFIGTKVLYDLEETMRAKNQSAVQPGSAASAKKPSSNRTPLLAKTPPSAPIGSADPLPPPPTASRNNQAISYGIDKAVKLMKRLPEADNHLLATVIKECLESANIKIESILEDASQKEARLEQHIEKLDHEIENLESLIHQRKDTILELIRDLEETRQVRNNLALATEQRHFSAMTAQESTLTEAQPSLVDEVQKEPSDFLYQSNSEDLLESLFGLVSVSAAGDEEEETLAN